MLGTNLAVVGVADQYAILIAITLLFTVLALAYDKILLSLLAGIAWLVCAIGHFAVGDQTSALTQSLSWLFFAFSFLFIMRTILHAISGLGEKKSSRWKTTLE